MSDFNSRFEQLLSDIHQIRIDAAESKSETKILSARLNGTVENMNQHLNETDSRQQALNTLKNTIIVQIIAFVFFAGGLAWMVNHDHREIQRVKKHCELFIKHIAVAEFRWEIFKPSGRKEENFN